MGGEHLSGGTELSEAERWPTLFGHKWMVLDGLRYQRTDGKVQGNFPWNGPRSGMNLRPNYADNGYYNSFNGVMFVNHDGHTYAAPHSEAREEAVRRVGYQQTFLQIIGLLDHERLADPEMQKRFEQLNN